MLLYFFPLSDAVFTYMYGYHWREYSETVIYKQLKRERERERRDLDASHMPNKYTNDTLDVVAFCCQVLTPITTATTATVIKHPTSHKQKAGKKKRRKSKKKKSTVH